MSLGTAIFDLSTRRLNRRLLTGVSFLFSQAESCGADPDRCAAGRWVAAMLCGNFPLAWRESDAIRRRGCPDSNRFWNGERIQGQQVIVRCLHGYGDAIQFLRYAPSIKASAARVIVECAPRAVELIQCLAGIDEVVSWEANPLASPIDWQVQVEAMELPYLFRTQISDLPVATNYLRLPNEELERAEDTLGPKTKVPRIGIVWSAGEWNPSRSLPLHMLRAILLRMEFEFWNLQGGSVRERWKSFGPRSNFRDTPLLADLGLLPLAALIAKLDLVITVDTLAAHLAGALGVPCFLLLQHVADWRWMMGCSDSPWYPSLRLFRQPRSGEWASVVREVDLALKTWSLELRESRLAA